MTGEDISGMRQILQILDRSEKVEYPSTTAWVCLSFCLIRDKC